MATHVATVARIVWCAITFRLMTQLQPWHFDVADVIVAVAGIEVEHGDSLVDSEHDRVYGDHESDYAKLINRRQFGIGSRRTVYTNVLNRGGLREASPRPVAGVFTRSALAMKHALPFGQHGTFTCERPQ